MQTLEDFRKINKNFNTYTTLDIAYLASLGLNEINRKELEDWKNWSEKRKEDAVEQLFYKSQGIDVGNIDGFIGPQTKHAREIYHDRITKKDKSTTETWRDNQPEPKVIVRGNPKWPNESKIESFYGAKEQNQVDCKLPFEMVLDWDPTKKLKKYSCHKLVKDPMERIWNRTFEKYGYSRIVELRLHRFGGCLNVRKKRGSANSWSTHSWGIAVDIDPGNNPMKMTRKSAPMAGPEYDDFWKFVEDEGAISLGRTRDFDWQHFQFANLG